MNLLLAILCGLAAVALTVGGLFAASKADPDVTKGGAYAAMAMLTALPAFAVGVILYVAFGWK